MCVYWGLIKLWEKETSIKRYGVSSSSWKKKKLRLLCRLYTNYKNWLPKDSNWLQKKNDFQKRLINFFAPRLLNDQRTCSSTMLNYHFTRMWSAERSRRKREFASFCCCKIPKIIFKVCTQQVRSNMINNRLNVKTATRGTHGKIIQRFAYKGTWEFGWFSAVVHFDSSKWLG